MATESKRMKQLVGTTADWAANNIVLLQGELGMEITDSSGILGKIGDGTSQWSDLPYSFGGVGFIPLDGTGPSDPVTGPIQFDSAAEGTQFSLGLSDTIAGFEKYFLITAEGTSHPDSAFGVITGQSTHLFNFTEDGRLRLPIITYGGTDGNAAASKDYVDAAVSGGISGDFVPLAGTGPTEPVTGTIEYENISEGTKFATGLTGAPGFEKSWVIAANGASDVASSVAIVTGPAAYTFEFTEGGFLNLANSDYTGAASTAAATKQYVDDAVAGGVSGEFVPLVGTTPANPMTGYIDFFSSISSTDFFMGLTDTVPGFENSFGIVARDTSAANSAIVFFTGASEHIFGWGSNGGYYLPATAVAFQGIGQEPERVPDKGYVDNNFVNDTAAQTVGGVKTFSDGIVALAGSSFTSLLSGTITLNSATLQIVVSDWAGGGNQFVRVDNAGTFYPSTDVVTLSGSQTISGSKTFSQATGFSSIGADSINLSAGSLPLVVQSFGGGGTRYVLVNNSGVCFASSSPAAVSQSDITGLEARLAAIEARLDAAGL